MEMMRRTEVHVAEEQLGRGGFLMEGPDNGEEMMWVFILCMKRHDARGNYNNDTLFLYSTADFSQQ